MQLLGGMKSLCGALFAELHNPTNGFAAERSPQKATPNEGEKQRAPGPPACGSQEPGLSHLIAMALDFEWVPPQTMIDKGVACPNEMNASRSGKGSRPAEPR